MDALETLFTRRSIRKYTDQPIGDAEVETMLKAAMLAPSANNKQPWHFIVVAQPERLKVIAGMHPYARMAAQARLAVVVCGDAAGSPDYWVQDCAAATENLMLAARAIGIGSVWCGLHPREERKTPFKEYFTIPDGIEPFAVVVLGYPDQPFTEADNRLRPDRIHRDQW